MSSSVAPQADIDMMDFGDRHASAMLIGATDFPILGTHQPAYLGRHGLEVWLLQDLIWANLTEEVIGFEVYSPDMELLVNGEFRAVIPAGKTCRLRAGKLVG